MFSETSAGEERIKILTSIVINGSPHFGGDDQDLTQFVNSPEIKDVKQLADFYIKDQRMQHETKLQKDLSGQDKRLIEIFLEQVQKVPEYKSALGDISKDMKRYFKKPTQTTQDITYTVDNIYEELEATDVE